MFAKLWLLEGVPETTGGMRWCLVDGATVFSVEREIGASFTDFVARVDVAAGISLMADYLASVELGRILPPGTLVHGKLANGLALENRIKPIFVGRGFGNYEDRKTRDDVRYILTYVAPSLGYESQARNPVIQDVLDAYPSHRIIMTFDVAETTTGHDRAALIDKFGSASAGVTGMTGRAQPGPDETGRARN